MKNDLVALSLSLLLGLNSWAQGNASSVVVLAHRSSPISYQAYLHTEDYQIAFSRFQLEHWHSPTELAKLKESIATLLKELGQVPAPLLTKKYSQLLSQAYSKNWPPTIRNELARMWLVTYTLETDAQMKAKLLNDLVRFHPSYQPATTAFAPPVISAWQRASAQRSRLNWQPGLDWQGFRYLIVNGAVVDLNDQQEIILPDLPVHLTAISDQYFPLERIIEARELLSWQPTKEILLGGTCDQPQWNPRLPTEKILLVGYFGDDCVQKMPLPTSDHLLRPSLSKSEPANMHNLNLPPLPVVSPPTISWKWVILGGLVAGAIGVQLHRNQSGTSGPAEARPTNTPVVHQGF